MKTEWTRPAGPTAALVPSPGGLLFADGRGAVIRLADDASAAVPAGSFRQADGDPVYVAEGGDVFRLRGLALERVESTGEPDDMRVEAFGFADGRVLIALGVGAARDTYVPGAWRGPRDWRSIRVSGTTILAAAPGGLLVADASTGAGATTDVGGAPVPIGVVGGRAWVHTGVDALIGVPDGRITLAWPRPRVVLDGTRAAVMTGALVAEEVDLVHGVVVRKVDLSAVTSSAQPLAFAEGRLIFRDREARAFAVDFATGAIVSLAVASPRAAAIERGRLYLLDGDRLECQT